MIVGGHGYDVPGLKALFDSLDGVDWYLQDIDNWVGSPIDEPQTSKSYDVFVFYHMVAWGIWSLRADMKERIDEANAKIGATGEQGWFVWHHALFKPLILHRAAVVVSRQPRLRPRVQLDRPHPEEAGPVHAAHRHERARRAPRSPGHRRRGRLRHLGEAFCLRLSSGEGFALPACRHADSTVLLTHDHDGNIPSLAWCHELDRSRVLCWQSGHDATECRPTPASSESSSRALPDRR